MNSALIHPDEPEEYSHRQMLEETKLRRNHRNVYNLLCEDLYCADKAKLKLISKACEFVLYDCLLQVSEAFDNDEKMTIFEIPSTTIGDYAEYYDINECIVYLIHTLRNRQFYVRFKKPNFIIISWTNQELRDRFTKNEEIVEQEDLKTVQLYVEKKKEREKQQEKQKADTISAIRKHADKIIKEKEQVKHKYYSSTQPVSAKYTDYTPRVVHKLVKTQEEVPQPTQHKKWNGKTPITTNIGSTRSKSDRINEYESIQHKLSKKEHQISRVMEWGASSPP